MRDTEKTVDTEEEGTGEVVKQDSADQRHVHENESYCGAQKQRAELAPLYVSS